MFSIRKIPRKGLIGIGLVAVAVAGVSSGFAFADPTSPPALPPAGVANSPGGPVNPNIHRALPTNAKGQTFGAVTDVSSPDDAPDLILAVATNGKTGYVLRSELYAAEGDNVKSPEEAVQWQKNIDAQVKAGHGAVVLTVYESDGVTKVGVFVVRPPQPPQ
jgi:hypothetical protein